MTHAEGSRPVTSGATAQTSVLASIPAVHEVLQDPTFAQASAGLAPPYRTRLVRGVIEKYRQELRGRQDGRGGRPASVSPASVASAVVAACVREVEVLGRPFPRRVVNGTGVLNHTNLGRAPLGALLTELDGESLGGYTDLEWDSVSQGRGDRDLALQRQLRLLTGAEAAIVVNNCASAVFLALATLATGKDVLVSRSELVEIGGSFRVPEIMEASGCRLREVGTTNKTRITDYERHANSEGSVLLKVHQSNFVQRGFVEQVEIGELVALGRRLGIPVIEDNGSGLMVESDDSVLAEEPRVLASLEAGVDVLCCSGDKLLGGVQAGIVVGRAGVVRAMRGHPLFRVLRLDKVRMALLSRTLQLYLAGRAADVPVWRAFHTTLDELAARAARIRLPGSDSRWASSQCVPTRAKLGGGSNPEADFASLGLELVHQDILADELKRRFAARAVPIVGYVQRDRFYLDLRTIFPQDLPEIQQALDELSDPAAAG